MPSFVTDDFACWTSHCFSTFSVFFGLDGAQSCPSSIIPRHGQQSLASDGHAYVPTPAELSCEQNSNPSLEVSPPQLNRVQSLLNTCHSLRADKRAFPLKFALILTGRAFSVLKLVDDNCKVAYLYTE